MVAEHNGATPLISCRTAFLPFSSANFFYMYLLTHERGIFFLPETSSGINNTWNWQFVLMSNTWLQQTVQHIVFRNSIILELWVLMSNFGIQNFSSLW